MRPFTIAGRYFSSLVICDSFLKLPSAIKSTGIMKCVQCQGYKTDAKHLLKFLSLKYCQKSDCWRDLKCITNLFEDFSENAQ